jgi:hypothetical protein
MSQEYKFIDEYQSKINYNPGATLTTLIGNKGGGKNTYSTLAVAIAQQEAPLVPRFANTKIKGSFFIPDMLKWIGTKYVAHDESPTENDIDEAAVAGLESRGSYQPQRALDSYLFTMSRKVNASIRLLSQLLSMIEKRTQWISDFYILCESHYEGGGRLPAYFSYRIYDENLQEVNEFEIDGNDARDFIYQRFRTAEIPFQKRLTHDFARYYDITDSDVATYDEIMGIKRPENVKPPEAIIRQFYSHKSFRTTYGSVRGETLMMEDKKYIAESRMWVEESEQWLYFLRQIG